MEYDNPFFGERLAKLRIQKGISAREMSFAIGQSANYINKIEGRKSYPSMSLFFYICDYLGITPEEFFRQDMPVLSAPKTTEKLDPSHKKLEDMLKHLDEDTCVHLTAIVKALTQTQNRRQS
ncbi:MAG: helix-turn-helix domain-containing protein [Defluviitaleaceae bacterium]|nr:helix-turn-helix domain-containing protein [Defluviitaleaceae bacterium]